jgi:hypothetical protein
MPLPHSGSAYSCSIMFDEASDISMNNMLNVFVNILLPNGQVRTLILTLCELEAADAGTVYNTLLQVLHNYDVPLLRVTGICSDGAATMQGVHRGVCTRLAQHIRDLRGAAITSIRDSTAHGKNWWGYVAPCNYNK